MELSEDELQEQLIQKNLTNWQSNNPLAPLTNEQLDIVYEAGDLLKELYGLKGGFETKDQDSKDDLGLPYIESNRAFINWMISNERDVKHENLREFEEYFDLLNHHNLTCNNLFERSDSTLKSLDNLKETYENVTSKTNYLHDLSENLLTQQRILKEKKTFLYQTLVHFTAFNKCQESIEKLSLKTNSNEFLAVLNTIDEAIEFLESHMHFKESRIHKMKYKSLLNTGLNKVYIFVNNIISDTTKQVVQPTFKPQLLSNDSNSVFSLYYGKFQSSATKIRNILLHLEQKDLEPYKTILFDCQKSYFTQRLPVLHVALSKALLELKEKHHSDHSILFRSCCLFTMKVCQDEARCYNYFFEKPSAQLNEYLSTLCQSLYDILRPSLIAINHIEVLSEMCGILKREMLTEKIIENDNLVKYVETIRQLLQDVEERLFFRTNIFIQYELNGYKPSPGDLAYPEKLEQMENIALELRDRRSDSVASLESISVAQVSTSHQTQFRSYTGNSPADLHGMWYPTVKRTLVCLSRLYYCLDRDVFQGLAQEALVACVRTIEHAANLISDQKNPIDGHLFQIKHLLIIREQIAPFQVDFTVKEVALDFSSVQRAAVDFLHNRSNLFKFSSHNALLEFLLEGTPKVKEYLIDSRKDIDKQLKHTCETFITFVTKYLVGNIVQWLEKATHILKIIRAQESTELTVVEQEFGKPDVLAQILIEAQRNMKNKIPEVQRSMQLYLANRETEFILFRPIKNNILNAFIQVDEVLLNGGYSADDQLLVACPSPEQVNILVCSVSLANEGESSQTAVAT